jgi:hypothetical protein
VTIAARSHKCAHREKSATLGGGKINQSPGARMHLPSERAGMRCEMPYP